MSQTPGSFRPSELEGTDAGLSDADLAGAWSTARELEAALPAEPVGPSAGFADRVMAAVALEPAPRPAGFLAVLRARPGLAGLTASVREAWAVVGSSGGRPIRARGFALAYVLVVLLVGTSLTGLATYGAAGLLGLLDGDASPTPTVQESAEPSLRPTPSAMPTPAATPSPTPSATPTESVEPDESSEPEESDDHESESPGASSEPSPDASDDDDSSPEPSLGDDSSPEPGDTPRPSDTPKPSGTPH